MKSYDYDAVVYDGDVYCKECLPDTAQANDTSPIFAGSEWDCAPVCCECGCEHDYVTILQ